MNKEEFIKKGEEFSKLRKELSEEGVCESPLGVQVQLGKFLRLSQEEDVRLERRNDDEYPFEVFFDSNETRFYSIIKQEQKQEYFEEEDELEDLVRGTK